MRICIVTPSLSGGGAEKVAVNLANHYAESGKDTTLLVFINKGPYKSHLSDKVKVVDLSVTRSRYAIFKLRSALLKIDPTHVVSVIRDASIVLGLVGKKGENTVFAYREANTLHGMHRLTTLKKWVYRALLKEAYKKADVVIANSEDTKEDLVKNHIIDGESIKVIRNPVIPEDLSLKLAEEADHPWMKSDEKVVLNVGRLDPQKNQKLLIDAFFKVVEKKPGTKLLILGEGEQEKPLRQQIKRLKLNHCVDLVPFQQNPFPYYQESDLFVLTSDWEGFGNILVEALACGTPIVSTDCPGGPRSILADGKYGTLVSVDDAEELADAIIGQLENSDRWDRDELVRRGLEYTVGAVAEEYLNCIKVAKTSR